MKNPRNILVTSALPYANGPIHLGHLLEHIQMDIWARFQRLQGHTCYSICGADAHGTPIMINAEKQGITPEEMVNQYKDAHKKTFENFLIHYDCYHTTHSEENRELSALIYEKLKAKGSIVKKIIRQKFDPIKEMFLPDRYVKGTCPRCKAEDQYGDNCEKCGATYTPTDLINPFSVLSGATPIEKETEHCFFDLPQYADFLQTWTKEHTQGEIFNKLQEWFADGLQQWDISRDAPYFGFEIPGEPGKYFYVWLDAPVGYMASFKKYCETSNNPALFDQFWQKNTETELYHFVGKDIIYFHTLFWPAMLEGSDFRTPNSVFAHGFITVNGEKMSKSRGTFITAEEYFNKLSPEYLRYYFAAKLTKNIEDVDLSWEDFRLRVNSDIVGKVVNLASRSAKFIHQYFNGNLSDNLIEKDLWQQFIDAKQEISDDYEGREYARVIRRVMGLADLANQYIDTKKPWTLIKETGATTEIQEICSLCLNLFRILILYLKPVMPSLAQKTAAFLKTSDELWSDIETPLLSHTIAPFEPLATRVAEDIF